MQCVFAIRLHCMQPINKSVFFVLLILVPKPIQRVQIWLVFRIYCTGICKCLICLQNLTPYRNSDLMSVRSK